MTQGRPQIDAKLCKGCELCVNICPQKVLSMSEHINEMGVPYACYDDSGLCTACTFCALICPEYAIQIFKKQKVLNRDE